MLTNPDANFELARRLRENGAPLGELFAFISGLYFRGKLAYVRAFDRSPVALGSSWIITPDRGLVPATCLVTAEDLRSMAGGCIDLQNEAYRTPLMRDSQHLAQGMTEEDKVILLGSIASGKYVEPLLEVFSNKLCFPSDFIGRGDMSRGGLMLRSAQQGEELPYICVATAVRRGKRPPRLPKL